MKDMKIKKRLISGFLFVIVISVAIIIAALMQMNAQRANYNDILKYEVAANDLLTEIRLNANIAARNVRDMALKPGDSSNSELESRVNELLSDMDAQLKELEDIYPLDQAQLQDYITTVNKWGDELPAILNAINRGDGATAVSLIKNSCTPQLNAMATKAEAINDLLSQAQDDAVKAQERSSLISLGVILAVMAVAIILVLGTAFKLVKGIMEPTEEVRKALMGFSKGELDIPVNYESKNELGDMCNALRSSQDTLSAVIEDICYLLGEMANGNFDVRSRATDKYVGALGAVLESIRKINSNLSDTLAQIDMSAEQVSSGSEQVSTGAQALAQGATEQASAVEELSATITEISDNAKKNAENGEMAMRQSQEAGSLVSESSKYMEEMVEAMGNISQSSQEIGRIISTIENIAFQTNILALNAAVEAARAGSAGKGFAVVADEVRNLATKSDQAAKATKELIDHSIESVQGGNEIVKKVSEALSKTVEASNLSMNSLQEITKAVEAEAESIAQVTEGIDQISAVVQTNSATSEESAAASEELSSQASLMKELMMKFTLRSDKSYGTTSSRADAPADASTESYAADSASGHRAAANSFSKY
ncbi:methyl-accepting chemotaxis protein [Flintibacter faecis]|uniref:MCP four helix bundle domain-containing protein n=1 Tax=Flintibacter faecis TaxID=2763047 RepID=A0A8J6M5D8_9FIRM|nr:methyl-accepting chemotaxis protein [Flintibacter faecis]MBC5717992.1 MCP four helix bundle domain-containing protein [Flintibacter faecis]